MSKTISLAALAAALAFAAPAAAQSQADVESCLIDQTTPTVRYAFENNIAGGRPVSEEARTASNQALLDCERKLGWTRDQTVNAAAYATLFLRFKRVEAEANDRGIIRSRKEKLKRGAALLAAGDDYQFDIWLSRAGYPSYQHLTETRDFAYFEAWLQLLTARNRFIS